MQLHLITKKANKNDVIRYIHERDSISSSDDNINRQYLLAYIDGTEHSNENG